MLPFYEEPGIDRGTEFSGNRESHEYQLYLALEDVDHTRTKSPQTNGICERFHRTIQEEFYSVAFRKKLYRTLDELQGDLDVWLRESPMQTFLNSKHLAHETMLDQLTVTAASDITVTAA